MKVLFKPSFLKDFKKLPSHIQEKAERICFSIFPEAQSVFDLKGLEIKKIQGYNFYYRFKIGDYRFGFKQEDKAIIFARALHRKDIYRFFP